MMSLRWHFGPTLYTVRLFARTMIDVCLLAFLIEGLYLSERFISILKLVIDKPVGLENVLPLLASAAPEVHLALPLAILIATYRVILLSRENREFVVLASGGQSILPLLQFASAVGLSAMTFSLLVSGEVAPRAKFAFRANVDAIQYEALRGGSTPGQFLYFPNHTIYVWPTERGSSHPIFVKQILDDNSNRIVNARNIEIEERSSQNMLIIGMFGVAMNDFPNDGERWLAIGAKPDTPGEVSCKGCGLQLQHLKSSSMVRTLDVTKLLPLDPRGATVDEWTTPELLGWMRPPGDRSANPAGAEAMRRLARALLCLLAPFVSWLTLTFTTRRSQAFALPTACAAVMIADIGFSQLVTRLSGVGTTALWSILLGTVCAVLALLVAQIVIRQHLLIFPALGRS
ncbi:MAG: LptF/LptG family permease [Bradyrhizobium sp.]|uniref:LptF/LptG family permease n=1 Tax=Bradyrhizobium sp. TaxID=376 RepID=UPI003D0C9AAD